MRTILQLISLLSFSTAIFAAHDRLPYLSMDTWEVYGKEGVKINKDMQKFLTINTTNGYGSYIYKQPFSHLNATLNVSPVDNGNKIYSLTMSRYENEGLFRLYEVSSEGKVIQYSECKGDKKCKTATPEICSYIKNNPVSSDKIAQCQSLTRSMSGLDKLVREQSSAIYAKLNKESANVKKIQSNPTKTMGPFSSSSLASKEISILSEDLSLNAIDNLLYLKDICEYLEASEQLPLDIKTKDQIQSNRSATKQ